MFLKLLRKSLGQVVIFIDAISRPAPMERSSEQQALVEEQIKGMTLYQLYACPFCVKTRRALYRLNLQIETKDVNIGSPGRDELIQGGGRIQVPCLRTKFEGEDNWIYESDDIIRFLEQKFGELEANSKAA